MKVSGDLVQIKNKSLRASGSTPFSRPGGFEVLGHTVNCQGRAQRKGGNNLTQAARGLKATVGPYQVFADVVCVPEEERQRCCSCRPGPSESLSGAPNALFAQAPITL